MRSIAQSFVAIALVGAVGFASTPSRAAVRCPAGAEKKESRFQGGGPNLVFCVKDGRRHGPMERYYANGKRMLRATYKDGVVDGRYDEWHESGRRYLQGAYRAGKHHGVWKWWSVDGKLLGTTTLADGTGPFMEWDAKKGVKLAEGPLVDGRKEGEWRAYYPSGQLQAKMKMKAGRLNGTVTRYYAGGEKLASEAYVDGAAHGVVEAWAQDGTLVAHRELDKDQLHGRQLAWHEDGTFESGACFAHGTMKWRVQNAAGKADPVLRSGAVDYVRTRAQALSRRCP